MARLQESDLRILLGDNYESIMESDRAKEKVRLSKVKPIPKPPRGTTRIGAWMMLIISVISVPGGITLLLINRDPTTITTTLFGVIACAIMCFTAFNVLKGINKSTYRLGGALGLFSNALFLSPLLAELMSTTITGVSAFIYDLAFIACVNLVAFFFWFWNTSDCID